jgi:CO/xanthine dehydrogenase FAD-binding subunit
MIIEYHRPESRAEAVSLLSRKDPKTIVLGGGLYVNEVDQGPIAVVDVQALGLNGISKKKNRLQLGAANTLDSLMAEDLISDTIKNAISHQDTYNRRQVATIGGALVTATGRSPIGTVMLALDAELELYSKGQKQETSLLGDLLPIRAEFLAGKLITGINLPLDVKSAYEYVARSPADLPIVAAAAARWPGGRTRVVLAGYGDQPVMVFDGPDPEGAEIAARDAYSEAEDQWASAAYRSDTAGVLVKRCLENISDHK